MTTKDKIIYKLYSKREISRCRRLAEKHPNKDTEWYLCFGMNDKGIKWSKDHGYPIGDEHWDLYKASQNGYLWATEIVPYFEKRYTKVYGK